MNKCSLAKSLSENQVLYTREFTPGIAMPTIMPPYARRIIIVIIRVKVDFMYR